MRAASFLVFLIPLIACSPDPEGPGAPCTSTDDCPAGQMCVDDRCVATPDAGGGSDATMPTRRAVSVAIEPASADLVAVDGATPEQDFEAIVTYDDGTTAPAAGADWSIDTLALGNLDPASGTFVANGIIGGAATVSVNVAGGGAPLGATASLTVRIERTIFGPDVPTDAPTRFAAPVDDTARAAGLVYPLDGVVMPQNVYPADVQWTQGVAGDLFRVTVDKPSAQIVAYLLEDGNHHWLVDESAWRSLAQTDPDAPAMLTVDRWEAATSEAIAGTGISMTFARAALTGSVYYWDIAAGRIIRINDGTATRDAFMPNPPAGIDGNACVGCHSVSNSGRYMAGRLGGGENIGAFFDLTVDLTGSPAATLYPAVAGTQQWWFSSWSPDDTRLVISTFEGSSRALRIMDPFAGTEVPITGALPTNATHPSWSPDGTAIAYVSDVDAWGGNNQVGNIWLLPVPAADTVGAPTLLHAAGPSGGANDADSYPTWTPDSQRVAFGNGTGSRSENMQSSLYVIPRDGASPAQSLDRANGDNPTVNFQPRFSPFEGGGYYWLSFLSRRDYGNAQVGTAGSGFQQIWVTAIEMAPAAGTDPSQVGYWLPGQATTSRNISAYWAPRPCRPDGEECSVGSECCGGDCRPDEMGTLVCAPPPPDRCRMENETCTTDEDCCDMLTCFANVCSRPLL